jgi:hypothetical protein
MTATIPRIGLRTELARCTLRDGDRILYGHRVNGIVMPWAVAAACPRRFTAPAVSPPPGSNTTADARSLVAPLGVDLGLGRITFGRGGCWRGRQQPRAG